MIFLKTAYFNKVGKVESHGMIYRYIFASADPHMYFSAHIIPHETTYDLYAIPTTNNLDNSSAIKLDDNNNYSRKGIAYGEMISVILGNDDLEGMSDYVEVMIQLTERPIAIDGETGDYDLSMHMDNLIMPLIDAGLFKLSNIVATEVTSNMTVIKSHADIDPDRAVESFVFNILISKSVFMEYLPEGLPISKEDAYTLYSKILYGNAYTENISIVFADMINFFKIVVEKSINLNNIPTEILSTLVSKWSKDHSEQYIDKLIQASLLAPVVMTVELNPVTISNQTKLFQVLGEIQSFVYMNKLEVLVDDVRVELIEFDPKYFELLYRTEDSCRVEKGIEIDRGVNFIITYGYGQGCDEFVGMNLEDIENTLYYGINKKDTLVENRVEYAVVYQNGTESVAMLDGNLDSNLNVKFVLHGV